MKLERRWIQLGAFALLTATIGGIMHVWVERRPLDLERRREFQELEVGAKSVASLLTSLSPSPSLDVHAFAIPGSTYRIDLFDREGRPWRANGSPASERLSLETAESIIASAAGISEQKSIGGGAETLSFSQRTTTSAGETLIVRCSSLFERLAPGYWRDLAASWGVSAAVSVALVAIFTYILERVPWPFPKPRILRRYATLTNSSSATTRASIADDVDGQLDEGELVGLTVAQANQLQAELAILQSSVERMETVISAMVEGVVAVDAKASVLLANDAAARMLDFQRATAAGRPLWESVRLVPMQKLLEQVLQTGVQQRGEMIAPRTQSALEVVGTPIPGNPSPGVVFVLHDVSDVRRLENIRREFVANVSHELKTPLSTISACTESLLDWALDEPERGRSLLQRIEQQVDRLHTLIVDLLSIARLESTEHGYDIVPTCVSDVLLASVDAHLAVAQSKNVELATHAGCAELWAAADVDGLRTIVDNLLDNAINYTPSGGQVTIHWRQVDSSWAEFDVVDSGVGIAKEHQQRIFERFYRIDKARSREVGGTGLGLSIVKHLCQAFGGSVAVESELGRGSRFAVRLPLSDSPAKATT